MRIRNKNSLKIHQGYIITVGLIPLILVSFVGLQVVSMYRDMGEYTVSCGPPDASTFVPTNYTRMAEMAYTYDYLFENYHMPTNFSIPITWNENFTEVQSYNGDENDALIWTGTALAGQCFRYHAAKLEGNSTEQQNAHKVVTRLITGLSMFLKVPNGGLGSNYSGIVARYYGTPEYPEITPHIFAVPGPDFADETFFNGTGEYSNYRYSAHTSNDQHAGFYLGLSTTWKYVASDDPDLKSLLVLMIDQVCNFMVQNNFLVIEGNGGLNGADQKRSRITGNLFALVILKLGAVALPDKYESLYYHYLLNEQYLETIAQSAYIETLTSYYSINFSFEAWLSLLLLEDDPTLHEKIFSIFESSIYQDVKYHRNVWFNLIYLVSGNIQDNGLVRDVEDQLMRFDICHFPDRRYPILELNLTLYTLVDGPRIYNTYFSTAPYGGIYSLFFGDVGLEDYKMHTDKPLTVEYRQTDQFMWQRTPFKYSSGSINPQGENPGISFTTPYWMARAFGYINATGYRS